MIGLDATDQAIFVTGDCYTTAADLLDLMKPPDWHRDGLCREHPELSWFTDKRDASEAAKQVCAECLVRAECLTFALNHEPLAGIWGGHTTAERRRLRARKEPPVPYLSP